MQIFDFVKTFQWIEGQSDMNKAVFVGCSWSWGQGLELASPTSYGVDWTNRSQQWRELTTEQLDFIQTHRWSKRISDKLGLKEVNLSQPGNSNGKSLSTLIEYIQNRGVNDVSTIFFQLTHPFRSFSLDLEGSTPMTGWELAQSIESGLKSGKLDIREVDNTLHQNFEVMGERYGIFLKELTKWFDELRSEYPHLRIHLIEWVSEVQVEIQTNPYWVNLFGGETPMEWSKRMRLTGGDWMEDRGFPLLFPEGHLSIEGMEIFSEVLYDKIKPLYL